MKQVLFVLCSVGLIHASVSRAENDSRNSNYYQAPQTLPNDRMPDPNTFPSQPTLPNGGYPDSDGEPIGRYPRGNPYSDGSLSDKGNMKAAEGYHEHEAYSDPSVKPWRGSVDDRSDVEAGGEQVGNRKNWDEEGEWRGGGSNEVDGRGFDRNRPPGRPRVVRVIANPELSKCLKLDEKGKTIKQMAASSFDCAPTELDEKGYVTGANRDFRNWNSTIFTGSKVPVTGYYNKKGGQCSGLFAATKECPIAVKALIVYKCNPEHMINGKCPQASQLAVYHATFQDFHVPGEPSVRPFVVADPNVVGNTSNAAPIAMTTFAQMNFKNFSCATVGDKFIQLGTGPNGEPLCGPDPNQSAIDGLRGELCKSRLEQRWMTGGQLTAPCDELVIERGVFYLKDASDTNKYPDVLKTTKDCTDQGGRLYRMKKLVKNPPKMPKWIKIPVFNGLISDDITDQVSGFPGGLVSKNGSRLSPAELVAFATSNGLPFNNDELNSIHCRKHEVKDLKYNGVYPDLPVGDHDISLPDDFIDGTLKVFMVGGGGGGGAGDTRNKNHGGDGGLASDSLTTTINQSRAGMDCKVKVGAGGAGGDANEEWGYQGGETSIQCKASDTEILDKVVQKGGPGGRSQREGANGDGKSGQCKNYTDLDGMSRVAGCYDGSNHNGGGWEKDGGNSDKIGGGGGGGGTTKPDWHRGGDGGNGVFQYTYKYKDWKPANPK